MTTSAYVLARFSEPEKLLPAVERLRAHAAVRRWDAVEGHDHLVLKIEIPSPDIPADLRDIDGIESLHLILIEADDEAGAVADPSRTSCYAYVETDPDARDEVRAALKSDPRVLFCSPTSGECDLVLLAQGNGFDEVGRFISEDVRGRDGVLRVRQDWVINLSTF